VKFIPGHITYKRLQSSKVCSDSELVKSIQLLLSTSYAKFYGLDYHFIRMFNSSDILYLAFDDITLVGISYVKRNGRRGTSAIYPTKYRGLGIAKEFIKMSLLDYPSQYTFVSTDQDGLIRLLTDCGFKVAQNVEEIALNSKAELGSLSKFNSHLLGISFNRLSKSRSVLKENCLMFYHKPRVDV